MRDRRHCYAKVTDFGIVTMQSLGSPKMAGFVVEAWLVDKVGLTGQLRLVIATAGQSKSP